ncbi:type II toxin-antitoxin system HicB family antitoxin [Paenibacillus kribbensis]|uniref:type II toxin-antitoxin system HicB family antitoxin n=1 Tax=Paenibacillus kribbensis TaxID=172713 RepID=UPI000838B842|nr:type II toxin-antitoxin system HicB family antitoxin [Paenibacillus kribbensis]
MDNKYMITIKKWSDDIDGTYFVAKVPELKGCMSDGTTVKEALINAREAISGYLEVLIESGDTIPRPRNDKEIVQLLGEYTKEEIAECYQAVDKLRSIIDQLNKM